MERVWRVWALRSAGCGRGLRGEVGAEDGLRLRGRRAEDGEALSVEDMALMGEFSEGVSWLGSRVWNSSWVVLTLCAGSGKIASSR